MSFKKDIQRTQELLASSKSLVVLTGAGISADSNVPTFRGEEGLWNQYRAEDLATPEAFSRDPKLVWEWYSWRRKLVAVSQPNIAHTTLVHLEEHSFSFALITQNVDGLHDEAGSKNILELHGNIWKVRCTSCSQISENREIPVVFPPECKVCGGLLRPHIIWFGESLDHFVLDKSFEVLKSCDVLLVVGTSGIVQPAASFSAIAKEYGACTIEVNPNPTPLSNQMDIVINGKAKDVMPLLVSLVI